jgi:hypothetical protein
MGKISNYKIEGINVRVGNACVAPNEKKMY